jgi:hypothetical protein
MRQALVVGPDLIDGAATGGIRIQDLIQKGQEGESRRVKVLATVVPRLVGLEQKRINALGTEAFQVVEGTAGQGEAGVFEGGVELAEERGGGKHICICIITDIMP